MRCYSELRALHKAYELLRKGVTSLEELFLLGSCYTHMGKLGKCGSPRRLRRRAAEVWRYVAAKYDRKGEAKLEEVAAARRREA